MNQAAIVNISDYCKTHREKFQARPPDLNKMKNQDETRQITENDGVFQFVFPPADTIVFGVPPSSDADVKVMIASTSG